MDAPYAKLEELEPGIARVLAHNPSAFTYYGHPTYLIGPESLAAVAPGHHLPDPGPTREHATSRRGGAA